MPFNPSRPFNVVQPEPTTASGFDAARPFTVVTAQTPEPDFRVENELDAAGHSVVRQPPADDAHEDDWLSYIGETARDVAVGAGKELLAQGIRGGALLRRIPGVNALDRLMTPIEVDVEPKNTAQKIGGVALQVGEVVVPAGAVSRLGTKAAEVAAPALARVVGRTAANVAPRAAVEAGIGAGTAALQGGDPTTAAGMSAAIPVVGAVAGPAARSLQRGAEKTVAQALGATKEWAKSKAAKLAPEMLERGVKGTRASMLKDATEATKRAGHAISAAIDEASANGATVNGLVARGEIQFAKDALLAKAADGSAMPIEGAQAVVAQLDALDEFIERLGPQIPVAEAQRIKQAWDKIVSKAGLYGQNAGVAPTDQAKAWAVREAASSFRRLLADATPDLADLNREFAFWKGLKDVLSATELRTQAQGGGLVAAGIGGAGAIAGGASGDGVGDRIQKALIGGVAARQLVKAVQSPIWRTAIAGPMKQRLADALASGDVAKVSTVLERINATQTAQVTR